ncbi:MAG: sialate O-acetylesterase [Magnetococcales bacterium]|nr:hypothetical protein [Magnetococcales bacterium]NGZ28678.1 sialate O-acetylesterase [Magnetococcales bacterium]
MKRFPWWLWLGLLAAVGAILGAGYDHYKKVEAEKERTKQRLAALYQDVSDRTEVSCASLLGAKTAVILTMGQSNANNAGETPYQPKGEVFALNTLNNKCYYAKDPMLGLVNFKGSVWTRFGEKLVEAGVFERVLFISTPIGFGSVKGWFTNWQRDLSQLVKRLMPLNLTITHVIWHQGENDARSSMTQQEYAQGLEQMVRVVRELGIQAPIFISVTSICNNAGSDEVRQAQRQAVHTAMGIFAGPDTDSLNQPAHRYDGCHFSQEGLLGYANLLQESFKKQIQSKRE